MQLFYSDCFNIPLPAGHRFPGQKYGMLRESLLRHGVVRQTELLPSPLADIADIEAAHDPAYVEAVVQGGLTASEQRRIGLPWSEWLVRRSLATTGGAIAAARAAIETGFSAQLAGGTHHAHRDFGAGYCVFNDLAAVALTSLRDGRAARVAIIDLDVHQGDGNAAILRDVPGVFILDVYCEKNYPFRKFDPHLSVPLAAGTGDDAYLRALDEALPAVFAFRPDLVLYQAGVDPLREDRLGHLDLSYGGLMARDKMVFEACRKHGVPVSVAIGGGYAEPIEHSVTAYTNTFRAAMAAFRRGRPV
jgi:acetoin utilization deacetylase AcuC-like enzyme